MTNNNKKSNYKLKKHLFYDGFNSELIEKADFMGDLEVPIIRKQDLKNLPSRAIPYSKVKYEEITENDLLVFYEYDEEFRKFVSLPQDKLEIIKDFKFVSTPDCSVYRDMPFWTQITNICVSRSLGVYLQDQGFNVIPNVRWGDERTYESKNDDVPIAFAGIPKGSAVSIGTYGCSQSKEDKYHLENGLKNMINYIKPKTVIVYGSMNSKIFDQFKKEVNFVNLKNYTSYKRG